MLPSELRDALQQLQEAMELAPAFGCIMLAVPAVAVAVNVLGRWKWDK